MGRNYQKYDALIAILSNGINSIQFNQAGGGVQYGLRSTSPARQDYFKSGFTKEAMRLLHIYITMGTAGPD